MSSMIIDRGRGPEIAGTRITVFDILDYAIKDWHHTAIAAQLQLSTEQVETALGYIEAHKEDIMAEYREMLARDARGNGPELQERLDALHRRFLQHAREVQAKNGQGGGDGGGSVRREC